MFYPVCGTVHIKDALLLIGKRVTHEVAAVGFLFHWPLFHQLWSTGWNEKLFNGSNQARLICGKHDPLLWFDPVMQAPKALY